jgi:predicted transcriptional regulator
MKARSSSPIHDEDTKRLSISVASEERIELERIAKEKRVSLAWVVRDAISHYLKTQNDQQHIPHP